MTEAHTCPHKCGDAFLIQGTALDDEILKAAADAICAKYTNYRCQAAFDELGHFCFRSSRCRPELATTAGDVHMTVHEAWKDMPRSEVERQQQRGQC